MKEENRLNTIKWRMSQSPEKNAIKEQQKLNMNQLRMSKSPEQKKDLLEKKDQ